MTAVVKSIEDAKAARRAASRPLDALRALRDSDTVTTPTELLVLVALVLRASNETGQCYPSHRTLARDTRLSKATVKRTLMALAARGLVSVEPRRKRTGGADSNVYRVRAVAAAEGSTTDVGGLTVNPPPAHHEPTPSSPRAQGGVTVSYKLPKELPRGLDPSPKGGPASPAAESSQVERPPEDPDPPGRVGAGVMARVRSRARAADSTSKSAASVRTEPATGAAPELAGAGAADFGAEPRPATRSPARVDASSRSGGPASSPPAVPPFSSARGVSTRSGEP